MNELRLWIATFRRAWSVFRLRQRAPLPECAVCGTALLPAEYQKHFVMCDECAERWSLFDEQLLEVARQRVDYNTDPTFLYDQLLQSRAGIGYYAMGDPGSGYDRAE